MVDDGGSARQLALRLDVDAQALHDRSDVRLEGDDGRSLAQSSYVAKFSERLDEPHARTLLHFARVAAVRRVSIRPERVVMKSRWGIAVANGGRDSLSGLDWRQERNTLAQKNADKGE
jgi:hypothetical protein